jgi:hypothetical protein
VNKRWGLWKIQLSREKMCRLRVSCAFYDCQSLECLYGLLNLESREGHSFTKGPVLIVEKTTQTDREKPTPITEALPATIGGVGHHTCNRINRRGGKSLPRKASDIPLTFDRFDRLVSLVTA